MTWAALLLAGLTALATLAASPCARAEGLNPSKHECVEASEAGQDLQQAGKLRDARTKLALCVAQSCPGPVREDCGARLRELDKAMPSIVFEFKDASGNEALGVTVTLDGAPVSAGIEGKPLDVDPGEHVFRFEVAGQTAVERKLIIHEGEKGRRERVVFPAAPLAPAAVVPPLAPMPVMAPAVPPEDGGHGRRVLGLASSGAGLAGLVIGGIFGGATFSSWGRVNSECPTHAGCSAQAIGHHADAVTFGAVSTAGFIAGGVLLAGGLTLWLTAPRERTPRVGIQMAPGGLGVAGTL